MADCLGPDEAALVEEIVTHVVALLDVTPFDWPRLAAAQVLVNQYLREALLAGADLEDDLLVLSFNPWGEVFCGYLDDMQDLVGRIAAAPFN